MFILVASTLKSRRSNGISYNLSEDKHSCRITCAESGYQLCAGQTLQINLLQSLYIFLSSHYDPGNPVMRLGF